MAQKKKKQTKPKLVTETERLSWDMMPSESVRAYTAFCWYKDSIYATNEDGNRTKEIDITKERSYRETARHFKLAPSAVQTYMTKFNWVKRCEAYDRYIALCVRQENDKKIKKMLNNHAIVGAAMVNRAAKCFASLPDEALGAADAIRMADVGVKIERQARGIGADENVVVLSTSAEQAEKPKADVDVTPVVDVSTFSDEELSQLYALVSKLPTKSDDK